MRYWPILYFTLLSLQLPASAQVAACPAPEYIDVPNLVKDSERGDADAMVRLGDAYMAGSDELERDPEKAVSLYRRSSELGHSVGTYKLAKALLYGDGVAVNETAARELFKSAASDGIINANAELGRMEHGGWGGPKDLVSAARNFKIAAERGIPLAQGMLGYAYSHGEGVPQDYVAAAKWYRQAAEHGDAVAANNLGDLYETGNGVPKDLPQAIKFYKQASLALNSGGFISVGNLFEHGIGVAQDLKLAYFYYWLANKYDESGRRKQALDRVAAQLQPDGLTEAVGRIAMAARPGVPGLQ